MSPCRARAIRVPGQSDGAIPTAWGLPRTVQTHIFYGADVLCCAWQKHAANCCSRVAHAHCGIGIVSVQRRLVIVGLWWRRTYIDRSFPFLGGLARSGQPAQPPVRSFFHGSGPITDDRACPDSEPWACRQATTLADQIMISSPCTQSRLFLVLLFPASPE